METYLIHFGKKGQSWGVKNGPPYPLNSEGLKEFRKRKAEKLKTKNEHLEKKS